MADFLKLRRNVRSCVKKVKPGCQRLFVRGFGFRSIGLGPAKDCGRHRSIPPHARKKPSSLQLKLLRDSSLSADANLRDQVTLTTNFHTFRSSYLNEV